MLQIVASLIDAARGVIYDRHMFIVQATDLPQKPDAKGHFTSIINYEV